jgi:7-keto-8-aminopelargonate synthetase-like enzyme
MSRNYLDTLKQSLQYAKEQDITYLSIPDEELSGKMLTVKGRKMINFGSCSYLGLEYHPRLIEGCTQTAKKLGTQFSSSRTFASIGLYQELEGLLAEAFQKPVLVSATTTLGHLSALPVLVGPDDAVILDMQVHSSVQMAAQLLKAQGIPLTIIRHNDMEALEKKIVELKTKHNKIWYLADGVYSMYGDFAPFAELTRLLNAHKQFNLYIDDAHGASWAGENGVGVVRQHMEHHDRMYLTVSLNKSFASCGGAIVFPDQESFEQVKMCGGTMIFSGPIQPPMLGTAIASVKLHMSGELKPMQDKLKGLIDYCNEALEEAGIPQFQKTDSPIFFIPVGLPKTIVTMANAIQEENVYVNTASFPAVPMKRGGIRFMVNNHHEKSDIDRLVAAVRKAYLSTLEKEGITCKDISRVFRIPEFKLSNSRETTSKASSLIVERSSSIEQVDKAEWDAVFHGEGNNNSHSLSLLERVFSNNENQFSNWNFHYVQVRDKNNRLILSTFFTDLLTKDDMFASADVSRKVEEIRKEDAFHLTSRTVMLGCLITKANVLFLDRKHPEWKGSLKALIGELEKCQAESKANQIMLGEFMGERDPKLETFFLECGLSRMDMPSSSIIPRMAWTNHNEYLQTLSGRYRNDFKREIMRRAGEFKVVNRRPTLRHEIDHCYQLYSNVFEKSFQMNVPKLPKSFFEATFQSPDYDVLQLFLKDAAPGSAPVAFMLSHKNGGRYTALIVGLDYSLVRSHGIYKQILYRTVWRAWELGCQKLDLAYTAEMIKRRSAPSPHHPTPLFSLLTISQPHN